MTSVSPGSSAALAYQHNAQRVNAPSSIVSTLNPNIGVVPGTLNTADGSMPVLQTRAQSSAADSALVASLPEMVDTFGVAAAHPRQQPDGVSSGATAMQLSLSPGADASLMSDTSASALLVARQATLPSEFSSRQPSIMADSAAAHRAAAPAVTHAGNPVGSDAPAHSARQQRDGVAVSPSDTSGLGISEPALRSGAATAAAGNSSASALGISSALIRPPAAQLPASALPPGDSHNASSTPTASPEAALPAQQAGESPATAPAPPEATTSPQGLSQLDAADTSSAPDASAAAPRQRAPGARPTEESARSAADLITDADLELEAMQSLRSALGASLLSSQPLLQPQRVSAFGSVDVHGSLVPCAEQSDVAGPLHVDDFDVQGEERRGSDHASQHSGEREAASGADMHASRHSVASTPAAAAVLQPPVPQGSSAAAGVQNGAAQQPGSTQWSLAEAYVTPPAPSSETLRSAQSADAAAAAAPAAQSTSKGLPAASQYAQAAALAPRSAQAPQSGAAYVSAPVALSDELAANDTTGTTSASTPAASPRATGDPTGSTAYAMPPSRLPRSSGSAASAAPASAHQASDPASGSTYTSGSGLSPRGASGSHIPAPPRSHRSSGSVRQSASAGAARGSFDPGHAL